MDADELVKQAKRIIDNSNTVRMAGPIAEAQEFIRVYMGENSAFFKRLSQIDHGWNYEYARDYVVSILEAFIRYVENGLLEGVSILRKAQIDVVSDFLEQAYTLLDSKDVHAAAPTVIIGAALEEFLRNWVEEANLDIGEKKPGIDTYAKVLREAKLIEKQDVKDITAWAGLRNDAAHGEWDKVNDKEKISNMLHGVNLFMRKYAGRSE